MATENEDVEIFLAHHGIKGMHWGFRKQRQPGPGRKSSGKTDPKKTLSPLEHEVLGVAAKQGMTEDRMKRLYGPEPTAEEKKKFVLTDREKKALKSAAIVGGTAAVLYGLSRYGNHLMVKQQLGKYSNSEKLTDFWKDYQKSAAKMFLSPKDVEEMSTERVHLSAGSILKRISTEKETEIRPGGFYAAYKEEDVNRYKAVLPVFWKIWGIGDKSGEGHVVSLRAKKAIVTPSEREAFEHFRNFLDTPLEGGGKQRDLFDPNKVAEALGLHPKKQVPTDELALKTFRQFSRNWNNNDNPGTEGFFKYLKKKGFNAVIDHNDAGHLADQPLRVFNGSMFEVAGHERLTWSKIRAAQEALVKVAHDCFQLLGQVFLQHMMGVDTNLVLRI